MLIDPNGKNAVYVDGVKQDNYENDGVERDFFALPNEGPLMNISRGEGKNAPYIYSSPYSDYSISGDDISPLKPLAALIVNTLTDNILVNRFMTHWDYGGGSTYNLTHEEFLGLGILSYSIISNDFRTELGKIGIGKSSEVSFLVPVTSNQSATVGNAIMEYSGTLSRTKDGSGWSFKGTGYLTDTYDFDLHRDRPPLNWAATFAGGFANRGITGQGDIL